MYDKMMEKFQTDISNNVMKIKKLEKNIKKLKKENFKNNIKKLCIFSSYQYVSFLGLGIISKFIENIIQYHSIVSSLLISLSIPISLYVYDLSNKSKNNYSENKLDKVKLEIQKQELEVQNEVMKHCYNSIFNDRKFLKGLFDNYSANLTTSERNRYINYLKDNLKDKNSQIKNIINSKVLYKEFKNINNNSCSLMAYLLFCISCGFMSFSINLMSMATIDFLNDTSTFSLVQLLIPYLCGALGGNIMSLKYYQENKKIFDKLVEEMKDELITDLTVSLDSLLDNCIYTSYAMEMKLEQHSYLLKENEQIEVNIFSEESEFENSKILGKDLTLKRIKKS